MLEAARPVTVVLVSRDEPARAVIAGAYLKAILDGAVSVRSFGTEPAEPIDPLVGDLLREDGIFVREARPTPLDDATLRAADRVVAIGIDPETAARIPRIDETWTVRDPEGRTPGEIRAIRDEIKRLCLGLAGAIRRGEIGTVTGMAYAEGLIDPPAPPR